MKEQTCCFTGHRIIAPNQYAALVEKLEKVLEALIQKGYCYFGTGGALGFDTMAAQTVLRLQQKYPNIKLILVLPCKNQTRDWKQKDIDKYWEIYAKASKITYISEAYTRGCMHQRNRQLVQLSSVCICYQTKETGGTAYTVKYAKSHGLKIINLAT